jgi:hypothetical protein
VLVRLSSSEWLDRPNIYANFRNRNQEVVAWLAGSALSSNYVCSMMDVSCLLAVICARNYMVGSLMQ